MQTVVSKLFVYQASQPLRLSQPRFASMIGQSTLRWATFPALAEFERLEESFGGNRVLSERQILV